MELRRFGVVSSRASARGDLESACLGRLAAARRGGPAWIATTWDDAAAREPVDFVLDFANDRGRAAATPRAAYGIWSFHAADGKPPGWRTMIADGRSVHVRLLADLAGSEQIVLQEGALPIAAPYGAARAQLVEIMSGWPSRAAADIESGGWEVLARVDTTVVGTPPPPPTLAERAMWMASQPARRLWRWWREAARYDTWNVGVAHLDRPVSDVYELRTVSSIRWLPERPPLHYVADPFPYHQGGRPWLLVEDYGHPKGVRGRIARVDLERDPPSVEPVLSRSRHISYPYTFEDAGRVYCAVEMSQEDGCVVYELTGGGQWIERHHILRGYSVVDPTLVRAGDRWWLFCTDAQGSGSLALHAFHAAALGDNWTPHPLNPLKCDLSSARPGGRPFTIGSRLFRPSQDCSRTYGGAVNVMEIVELTPTRFREVPVLRLEPNPLWPYPDGLHTLVVDGDRIYLDAKKQRYEYLLWLEKLRHSRSAEALRSG